MTDLRMQWDCTCTECGDTPIHTLQLQGRPSGVVFSFPVGPRALRQQQAAYSICVTVTA